MNTSITYDNVTLLELCPTYSNHERQLVTSLAFWLDGILKSVLAIFGLLFNLSASYVLYQPKMRNSFNKCLIAKSGIDSIFLMISIVECFRRRYVYQYWFTYILNNIIFQKVFILIALACSVQNWPKIPSGVPREWSFMTLKILSTFLGSNHLYLTKILTFCNVSLLKSSYWSLW